MNIGEESIESSLVAGGATGCLECLQSVGIDSNIAAALAVIIAVLVRVSVDIWREKRRERNATQ